MLFNNRKFEKKQKCIAGPDEVDEIIKIERNTVGQQENDDWKNLENNDLRHLILEKFVN